MLSSFEYLLVLRVWSVQWTWSIDIFYMTILICNSILHILPIHVPIERLQLSYVLYTLNNCRQEHYKSYLPWTSNRSRYKTENKIMCYSYNELPHIHDMVYLHWTQNKVHTIVKCLTHSEGQIKSTQSSNVLLTVKAK